jgi:hypothetical protein
LKPSTPSYSLDSGLLIEMLLGTPVGRMMSNMLLSDSSVNVYTCHFNLSEAEYTLQIAWPDAGEIEGRQPCALELHHPH